MLDRARCTDVSLHLRHCYQLLQSFSCLFWNITGLSLDSAAGKVWQLGGFFYRCIGSLKLTTTYIQCVLHPTDMLPRRSLKSVFSTTQLLLIYNMCHMVSFRMTVAEFLMNQFLMNIMCLGRYSWVSTNVFGQWEFILFTFSFSAIYAPVEQNVEVTRLMAEMTRIRKMRHCDWNYTAQRLAVISAKTVRIWFHLQKISTWPKGPNTFKSLHTDVEYHRTTFRKLLPTTRMVTIFSVYEAPNNQKWDCRPLAKQRNFHWSKTFPPFWID